SEKERNDRGESQRVCGQAVRDEKPAGASNFFTSPHTTGKAAASGRSGRQETGYHTARSVILAKQLRPVSRRRRRRQLADRPRVYNPSRKDVSRRCQAEA